MAQTPLFQAVLENREVFEMVSKRKMDILFSVLSLGTSHIIHGKIDPVYSTANHCNKFYSKLL